MPCLIALEWETHPFSDNMMFEYRDEQGLVEALNSIDRSWPAGKLVVVLELSPIIRRNLRTLLKREHRASRLILIAATSHWPGTDSYGDLVLDSLRLGWDRIELVRQPTMDFAELKARFATSQLVVVRAGASEP